MSVAQGNPAIREAWGVIKVLSGAELVPGPAGILEAPRPGYLDPTFMRRLTFFGHSRILFLLVRDTPSPPGSGSIRVLRRLKHPDVMR
jgi:hypothetical protein